MSDSAPRYPQWKAPAEDGGMLIWPEPATIVADTISNHQRLSSSDSIKLQGISLPEIRAAARGSIGHRDEGAPLIATGHQTELYHPGVWAKLALINQAAATVSGSAIHFAVDTDSPKHLTLRWPGGSMPITDDPGIASKAWCGLLKAPGEQYVDQILHKLAHDSKNFGYQPSAIDFLQSLRRHTTQSAPLSACLADTTHELDISLGMRHRTTLLSEILPTSGYLIFAHHILARAAVFAKSYNRALGEFRRIHRTRAPTRPMPDLFVSDESVETPFWLDDLRSSARVRPSVFARDGRYVLKLINDEEFPFDESADGWESAQRFSQWLAGNQVRLSPRALTLTIFLRLLIVDQFVHGIGGGRYDQVADSIIGSFFNFLPPKFAVTTATLFLPQAFARERVCLPCVIHQGHQLKHRVLGSRKVELVKQIKALPRSSPGRAALFTLMHEQRKKALASDPATARWQEHLQEAQRLDEEDQTLFDRELFYAMQPRNRLEELIQKYRGLFG